MVAIPLYRFQIMKANGNALVVPNIVEGHSWSADKVKAICKTTHLYIRALGPLVNDAVSYTHLTLPTIYSV